MSVGDVGTTRSQKLVLGISAVLMWLPCLLLLLAGAPLWIGGVLATSAGTMTVQTLGTTRRRRRVPAPTGRPSDKKVRPSAAAAPPRPRAGSP